MKMKSNVLSLTIAAVLASGTAVADSTGGSGFVNYSWMNAVINKTAVKSAACPEIETDIYGGGFKVAQQRSFFGSLGATGSRWFPKTEQWAGVGVGPVKNNFGIYFSEIKKISELADEKEKRLPDNVEEISEWKVSDSAYWESQGGVAFYLGTGIFPIDIGAFVVATGGWANFLQKTGPNKVYVERSRKKIRSIALGVGVLGPSISVERAFENSNGFAYEFTLDTQEAMESFERFMAGDTTHAQDMSRMRDSGVVKLSDMSETRLGVARSFGVATPFIPILSFKSSTEHATDHVEEDTVWDEKIVKDAGIYIKQRNSFLAGKQVKEARSFIGGKVTTEVPTLEGMSKTDKLYGNFKYSYQSNWGQQKRLRKYIAKVKALTGLVSETCATVPAFKDTMGFNQVVLELNLSDDYVKELIGHGKSKTSLLPKIRSMAQSYQLNSDKSKVCDYLDNDKYDDNCSDSTSAKVSEIFSNLETYSARMNKSYGVDKKEFSKNMAKFGEEVWKSPFVFKAFFEKGKVCGQDFKFEVSGRRITRHAIDQKFVGTASCAM